MGESSPPYTSLLPFFGLGFLTLFALRLLYLRAFPQPIPGIPYDTEAATSILRDLSTLKNDPDGLAKWSSRQLKKIGSPVVQASR